jgi:hypothetical protein
MQRRLSYHWIDFSRDKLPDKKISLMISIKGDSEFLLPILLLKFLFLSLPLSITLLLGYRRM